MDMPGHCRFRIGIAEFGYYFFLRGLSFSSEIASDESRVQRNTADSNSTSIPKRNVIAAMKYLAGGGPVCRFKAGQVAPRPAGIQQKKRRS
jgi:hypothetical protein